MLDFDCKLTQSATNVTVIMNKRTGDSGDYDKALRTMAWQLKLPFINKNLVREAAL
jgi:hypothetical protein